jgi:uncharacterized protein (DUF58 family)
VTSTGKAYLLLTLGVGLGALNTGNNLLFLVLSLLLSTIVVSGVLSERALRYLRVERLLPSEAYAGEPFALRWSICSPKASAFALTIGEEGGELRETASIAFLPAGEPQVARTNALARRRGPRRLTGIRVTTRFPLGLFAKTRSFSAPSVLLVFPRRITRPAAVPSIEAESVAGRSRASLLEGTGDLMDLRPLREGEDARRVHWTKSAATGTLLRAVREREERSTFVLNLDPQPPGDAFERGCEEAAAATHRLITAGHEVGLESAGSRIRPAAGPRQERRILTALAWLGFEPHQD